MKVAFITRATLFTVPGGDTIQILETADHLRQLGISVETVLSNQKIPYEEFDLLHFFNVIRPADILFHVRKANKPFVVTPNLVDYSEYDENYRNGFSGWLFQNFSSTEYIKTVARWLLRKDQLRSKQYLWKGHHKTVSAVLRSAEMVLPNSIEEHNQLEKRYPTSKRHSIIPNGINQKLFSCTDTSQKDEQLVICAARIEGIKNQINLIKALNNTSFKLILIGEAAPNHKKYYEQCRQIAAPNIVFTGRLPQKELIHYYQKAKVHVLPSWFETCGLSSLEAAAMGCNVVITDKGFTREYFKDHGFYCDPANIESIYNNVTLAASTKHSVDLQKKISNEFTWAEAAKKTLEAYQSCLNN